MFFSLHIPTPPSINKRLRQHKLKQIQANAEVRKWKSTVGLAVRGNTTKQSEKDVQVNIKTNLRKNADIDNIVKPILDVLQLGPIINDKQVNKIIVEPDQTHPTCLLYTSPSPRDRQKSRMPSSA